MIPYFNTAVWITILGAVTLVWLLWRAWRGGRPSNASLGDALAIESYWMEYLIAVLLLSAVIRFSTVDHISITSDEGFFIYSAWRMHGGLEPYTGFILTQQPLYMYVTSFIFGVFGVGTVQAKILPVLASTATVALTYVFASRFWSRRHGIFSAAVIGLSPYVVKYTNAATAYAEIILLNMAASYLFLTAEGGRKRLLGAGACVGVAVFYKMLGAAALGPMVVYVVLRERNRVKDLAYVGLGAGVVFAVGTALLWSPEYVYQVFVHHSLYEDGGLWCKATGLLKVLAVDPWFMVPGLAGAALALRTRKRRPAEDYMLLYLLSTVPLLFILKYLCGFAHPYLYFTLSIPPMALLGGKTVEVVREKHAVVLVSLLLATSVSYYIYFVAESYNHAVVDAMAAYVEENSSPGDHIMGMSYLACPVAFKTGRMIPPEFMEFFHLRVGVEGYDVNYYVNATDNVKYAIMYDAREYPIFNRFLREHATVEKTYGVLKPIRIYRLDYIKPEPDM